MVLSGNKGLLSLGLAIALCGCATYRPQPTVSRYRQMLATWKNKDINNLMAFWGPPSSTTTMSNGDKMVTWANIKVGPAKPGGTELAQASEAYGYGTSRSFSLTPRWNCYTTAETNSSGMILKWIITGDSCVMDYTDAEVKEKLESLRTLCATLRKGDIIRLKPYSEDISIENQDFYFRDYNKLSDEITFSLLENETVELTNKIYRLDYLEGITIVKKAKTKKRTK